MKKLLSFLCLLLFTVLLVGCDSVQIKQQLQENHDHLNPDGDKGVCLYLGNIDSFPYKTKYVELKTDTYDDRYFARLFKSNNLLNNRLAGFTEIGMFTREKVGQDHGEDIYRYDLTDLGKQFLNQKYFCFGRVDVTDIENTSTADNSLGQKEKMVHFRFKIENVPDWVKDNIEPIKSMFGNNMEKVIFKDGSGLSILVQRENKWRLRGGVIIEYGFYTG